MKKRVEYIDAIRGITMILVVFSHIVVLCYYTNLSTYNSFFITFRMPLFYFISGWVMYNSNRVWNYKTIQTFFKRKFKILFISTTIFWAIFNLFYFSSFSIDAFKNYKSGYWFTYTLFEFFCMYAITICICKSLHLKSLLEDFVIVFAGFFVYLIFHLYYVSSNTVDNKPFSSTILNIMDYAGVLHWRFFIFFCAGSLVKKHLKGFHSFTDKNGVIALMVVAFFMLVLFSNKIVILPHLSIPVTLSYSFWGILVIYTFFRKNAIHFSKEKKIGRILQFIGTRTIDIYFLHFFFLPRNLKGLGEVLRIYNNPSIEFFITLAISMMVIALSLTIGSVIRLSPFLAQNLFGAKPSEQVTSK